MTRFSFPRNRKHLGAENFLSHLVQTDPFLKKFSKQDLQRAMSTTEAVQTESEQTVEDFIGVSDITSRQENIQLQRKRAPDPQVK